MKVNLTGMPWKALSQATTVPSFMTVMMIVPEKTPMFELLMALLPAFMTVNLDEDRRNWYGPNGLSTKYLCAKFRPCGGHNVRKNERAWDFSIFCQPLCACPWVKVTQIVTKSKALSQSSIVASIMFALAIVSETVKVEIFISNVSLPLGRYTTRMSALCVSPRAQQCTNVFASSKPPRDALVFVCNWAQSSHIFKKIV